MGGCWGGRASLYPTPASEVPSATVARVDPAKCTGCGRCVEACPFGAIEIRNGVAVVDEAICRGCRACASVCPTGAIS